MNPIEILRDILGRNGLPQPGQSAAMIISRSLLWDVLEAADFLDHRCEYLENELEHVERELASGFVSIDLSPARVRR